MLITRLGDIYLECKIRKGVGVEHVDRLVCFCLVGHGHKSETLRNTAALFLDEFHGSDGPRLGEQGVDFVLRGQLVQISYINSNIHFIAAFYPHGHMSGTAGNKMTATLISGSAAKGTTEIQLFIACSV